MLLKTSDLLLGKVRFSQTFAPGAIEFFDSQFRQTEPVVATGAAELSQATGEIRITGHLQTRMEMACDRCLETAIVPVESDFDLLYRPASASPEHRETLLHGVEAEVGFYEGDSLDLVDVLREQILLLLPMQRICREDCKGICPVCGQNRNQAECHCHEEPDDDRWAALRNLQPRPIK